VPSGGAAYSSVFAESRFRRTIRVMAAPEPQELFALDLDAQHGPHLVQRSPGPRIAVPRSYRSVYGNCDSAIRKSERGRKPIIFV
jgi:hypothetical protein